MSGCTAGAELSPGVSAEALRVAAVARARLRTRLPFEPQGGEYEEFSWCA
jgi:hypothetical protein